MLETRYSAAKRIFDEAGINVIGAEFTASDRAKTKSVVEDYINRGEQIDGVWMDAGDTAAAALEAFEDAGLDYPVISGEDQQDFLRHVEEERSDRHRAVLSDLSVGVRRSSRLWTSWPASRSRGPEWVLPQPAITQDTLDQYIDERMPALHYSLCGCQDLPGYPERWGRHQIDP